jgi:uncharacterized protein
VVFQHPVRPVLVSLPEKHNKKEVVLTKPEFWKNNKRYYDLKSYWRNLFGCNVHKLSIDAGFTCPNRDGHVAVGGCIYCDGRGSKLRKMGALPTVAAQIQSGKKYYAGHADKFIAYFQTFTNTYAPAHKLKLLYDEALSEENVIGLSIGTRPDCLPAETIALLSNYARKNHVWVELGLQSIHDKTLQLTNRGHNVQQFFAAVQALSGSNINICVHIIIGLPGETDEDILATAKTLAALPVNGIKIHSLLALEGTVLGEMYKNGSIKIITKEKYVQLTCDILELMPPSMVIQRLTADGYRDIFLAPSWAMNKLNVLNDINAELDRRGTCQGISFPV